MRNLFALVFVLSLVSGCYLSHERPLPVTVMEDSGPILGDAGPVPVVDSGSDMSDAEADAGTDADVDAGFDGLIVSLSPDSPASATTPRNSTGVRFATFDFTAGSTATTVVGLAVHRVGVGSTLDFSNVYLFDAFTGERLTTGRSINSVTNIATFNGLSVTVSPGFTRSLMLVGDMSAGPWGGHHAFEIVDVSAVLVGESDVSGLFPVRGNTFIVATIDAARLVAYQGDDLPDVMVGTDAWVSSFWLEADGHDMGVRRLTLLQAGSILNSDLTGLELYMGTARVAATIGLSTDKIVFQFPAGLIIPADTSQVFMVRAHVDGPPGRTIRTYLEYPADVEAIDQFYNAPAHVDLGSFDGLAPANFSEVTTR